MVEDVETSFAESDGLSIAYQLWGSGARNLVIVPGMVSHLEASLEHPGYLDRVNSATKKRQAGTFENGEFKAL